MWKNYLQIAFRQLSRQKMYSVIKIGGFALGISACLLIALYIRDEMSFDKQYPDAQRIYRVYQNFDNNGTILKGSDFQAPFAAALKAEFPEVEASARLMADPLFYRAGSNEVKTQDQQQNTYEEGFTFADQDFLNIFKIPMVYGDRDHALDKPNTIVLSKTKADKYFPHQNPIGKILYLDNDQKTPFTVSGVMADFPSNVHLHYSFLISLKGVELWPGEQTDWVPSNYPTYILLRPGINPARLEAKLPLIVTKYMVPGLAKDGFSDAASFAHKIVIHLQPVGDINLKSYDINDGLSHGDIRLIWLFGAIAVFILFLASVNFINLSTAKTANRAKEVGLRKAIGSYRSSLIKQFLSESVLYSFLSFILAFVIAWALLPYFNLLSGKSLTIPWKAWWFFPILVTFGGCIGLLSGLYPSFYLSGFKPALVLKGQFSRGSKNASLRSLLVVFQFTTSIILIIGTFIIYRQMQFILHRKLGFDKDQVLLIQGTNTLPDNQLKSFKNDLLTLSSVKSVSISDYLPIDNTKRNGNPFWIAGRSKIDPYVAGQFWIVDQDYLKTMGMEIVKGRYFSPDMPSDSQAVVINETMVNKLHLSNPIGQWITNGSDNIHPFHVIGVVADFNFNSMKQTIEPLCMFRGISSSIVSVKVGSAEMDNLIPSVTAIWKKYSPDQPIRYNFMDERFANMYADVRRTGRIFTTFSVLGIIIACLGLFALSAFMAEQRSKEISIRKVLGASTAQVTTLLSRDFVRLVVIAIVIACPIAWWGMYEWLNNFVYRTPITWWIFGGAGLLVIFIALLTISFQSVKAALATPIKNLRTT
jgi:putative ABC transport system permease protein